MASPIHALSIMRILALVGTSLLMGSASATDWAKRNEEFGKTIEPLLKQFCYGCHSGAQADSGLALTNFPDAKAVFRQRRIWENVAQRLDIGDMPPTDSEQSSDTDRKLVSDWIKSTLEDIDCGKTPNPGAVTLRRINRFEYRNSQRHKGRRTAMKQLDRRTVLRGIGKAITLPWLEAMTHQVGIKSDRFGDSSDLLRIG